MKLVNEICCFQNYRRMNTSYFGSNKIDPSSCVKATLRETSEIV